MNPIQAYTRKELRHALKRADATIFEDVVQFLLDDCREFGSGYLKEMIWKYITRYPLNAWDIGRLQYAALKYLERPMTPEFKRMCLAMARIATPKFWDIVKSKLDDENPRVKVNTFCLYAYSEGGYAGERKRLELKEEHKRLSWQWFKKHEHEIKSWLLPTEDRLKFLYEETNWQDGKIARKPANPEDLPIVYYNPTYDQEIATLDWRFCIPDVLLPKLETALKSGWLDSFTLTVWLYIVYILRKLNDKRAVLILIHFLEAKVDWKFESIKKSIIMRAVLSALKELGTPEAIVLITQREQAGR